MADELTQADVALLAALEQGLVAANEAGLTPADLEEMVETVAGAMLEELEGRDIDLSAPIDKDAVLGSLNMGLRKLRPTVGRAPIVLRTAGTLHRRQHRGGRERRPGASRAGPDPDESDPERGARASGQADDYLEQHLPQDHGVALRVAVDDRMHACHVEARRARDLALAVTSGRRRSDCRIALPPLSVEQRVEIFADLRGLDRGSEQLHVGFVDHVNTLLHVRADSRVLT